MVLNENDKYENPNPVTPATRDRPLPNAADAVAAAAAVVQADAEMVGRMLAEIRGGWLWALLTKPKPEL